MKKVLLKCAFIFVCIISLALLPACSLISDGPEDIARAFLDAIARQDYAAAYGYTWKFSPVRMSEEEFAEKYRSIFNGLGVEEIEYSQATLVEGGYEVYYNYTASYKTARFGELVSDFEMKLMPTDEGYAIDYTPALIFPDMDFGDLVSISTLSASRGEIFTADCAPVAVNDNAKTVYLDVAKVEDIGAAARAASQALDVPEADIIEKYNKAVKDKGEIVVIKAVSKNTLDESAVASLTSISGLCVDDRGMTKIRSYPFKQMAAHISGYARATDSDDIDKLKEDGVYEDGDYIPMFTGRSGIEQTYNEVMNEKQGVRVCIKSAEGEIKRVLYEEEAVAGEDVWLTIDADLQERAYLALASNLKPDQTGAVVVLNGDTGATLAAVSYPAYDPNAFVLGIEEEDYKKLLSDEAMRPLYSRFSQSALPPGSSFKPFTIVPVLEKGIMDASSTFPSSERIVEKKWTPTKSLEKNWYFPPITRHDDYDPPYNLMNAMTHSDNIFFAYAALQLGEEGMIDYLTKIGMDSQLEYDIPVAKANIINDMGNLSRKMLADMGYGQGEVLVTPLQLASMYTAFLNGGDMLKPYLVDHTAAEAKDGSYQTVSQYGRDVFISGAIEQSTIDTLLPTLKSVMQNGTGRGANVKDMELAGKTGTAEIGADKEREIGWMVDFNTEGEDRRLVLVMVDGPEKEGSTRYAVAKELMKYDADGSFTDGPADVPRATSTNLDDGNTDEPGSTDGPGNTDEPGNGEE